MKDYMDAWTWVLCILGWIGFLAFVIAPVVIEVSR